MCLVEAGGAVLLAAMEFVALLPTRLAFQLPCAASRTGRRSAQITGADRFQHEASLPTA